MNGRRIGFVLVLCMATCAMADSPCIDLVMKAVPVEPQQPGGPAYPFRVSQTEVTNRQFVSFLNDALANPNNERGQYLFFDLNTGDVLINDSVTGELGTPDETLTTLIFSPSVSDQIFLANGQYQVTQIPFDYSDHPVTGVGWFGAVKFSNWLTLEFGLPNSQRVYTEGTATQLSEWRPVVVSSSDWASRDLNETEKTALLALRGFRLPMDDLTTVTAGSFDEWHKMAGWDRSALMNRLFGFGRDEITAADANYRCSGDPYENIADCLVANTTPTGYYDGSDHKGAFLTNPNENSFGIDDLSGNVWEWMQGYGASASTGRIRSGSFRSAADSLSVSSAADLARDEPLDSVGFRVVQSVWSTFTAQPAAEVNCSAIWGGPINCSRPIEYCLSSMTDETVEVTVASSALWLDVSAGNEPIVLAPNQNQTQSANIVFPCDGSLDVGTHVSAIQFTDESGHSLQRLTQLEVAAPIAIAPSDTISIDVIQGQIAIPDAPEIIVSSQSESSISITTSVTYDAPNPPFEWLALVPASVTVDPLSSTTLVITVTPASLPIGDYSANVTIFNHCTGRSTSIPVALKVQPPISVQHPVLQFVVACDGEATPEEHLLVLTNRTDISLPWNASLDGEWSELLIVNPSSGELAPFDDLPVQVTLSLLNVLPPAGSYPLSLAFSANGVTSQTVQVTISQQGPTINTPTPISFAISSSHPAVPAEVELQLTNTLSAESEWSASFVDTSSPPATLPWLQLEPSTGVFLTPLQTASIAASLVPAAHQLPYGNYTGTITFSLGTLLCTTTRNATLTVGDGLFSVPMKRVSGDSSQIDGPIHDFRIGQYEITNAEFARFLNDSLAHPSELRNQNMIHNADGTVRLPGDSTLLFDSTISDGISHASAAYAIAPGKHNIPLVGVTWFGAVKFCNWLTLLHGMNDPDQRAYHEGATADQWYPITTDALTYASIDLGPAQRGTLASSVFGYRLPMDSSSLSQSLFNEWFKAAAATTGTSNNLYGFGRDSLTEADANYSDSCDSFETTGLAPVGYYDGTNQLDADCGTTADTNNPFGLYDLTGNAAEWIQDFGDSPTERAHRGGHFQNTAGSGLLTTQSRTSSPVTTASSHLGFRIVQSLSDAHWSLSGEPVVAVTGTAGGPFAPPIVGYEFGNQSPYALDAPIIQVSDTWLTTSGTSPPVVSPQSQLQLGFMFSPEPHSPGVTSTAGSAMVRIPWEDIQPNGPSYDFWISDHEVTNAEFSIFLNDAISNATGPHPDERSEHMYFDTDSGDIYVHSINVAEIGPEAPSPSITALMYNASVGRIQRVGASYQVQAGFDEHPVCGVSWYGAIKYCNWRTVFEGIPWELRAYDEGPGAQLWKWRPVTASEDEWLAGNFSESSRVQLVSRALGYRLPMDDGASGPAPFNEWYKAASWDYRAQVNRLFGFRNDTLTPLDANFFDSSDTSTNGTTPTGLFDGRNTLFQTPTTCINLIQPPVITNNATTTHGLKDMTGNVQEWIQEVEPGGTHRIARGGSWRDAVDSPHLTTFGRRSLLPDTTQDDLGFRVARIAGVHSQISITEPLYGVTAERHVVVRVAEPLAVVPYNVIAESINRGSAPSIAPEFTITNQSSSPMEWRAEVDVSWVTIANESSFESPLDPSESAAIVLEFGDEARWLTPGEHIARLKIENLTTGIVQTREVVLGMLNPVSCAPAQPDPQEFNGTVGTEFVTPYATRQYTVHNDALYSVEYQVSATTSWLDIQPDKALTGILAPQESLELTIQIGPSAASLPVGVHEATIRSLLSDVSSPIGSWHTDKTIRLIVADFVSIVPNDPLWAVGPELLPDSLPIRQFQIVNQGVDPVDVALTASASWISLAAESVELLPGQSQFVIASVNSTALELHHGVYFASVEFHNSATGINQCRPVRLTIVETVAVEPFASFRVTGAVGGAIAPLAKSYGITNVIDAAPGAIHWLAEITPPTTSWVHIINNPPSGAIDDGDDTSLTVAIDPNASTLLAPGSYEATLLIHDLTNNATFSRDISLTLVDPIFNVSEMPVISPQPNGPTYAFCAATHHTTNDEFAMFLNNALVNLDNPRGQYMYYDQSTGDAYINNVSDGAIGTGANGLTAKLFSPAASGQMLFDGVAYSVIQSPVDYSQHPVAGVSWYGAVKYANWLTLDQGMSEGHRCCLEDVSTDLAGWRPRFIDAAAWSTRDLNDSERLQLTTDCRGYRLPMDDGHNNTNPATDAADDYNEWFKAAAWKPVSNQNALFGFGRNVLTSMDANFKNSSDPFDNNSTPVGYYGGANAVSDFPTNSNANGFGLYDMTGNVHQWILGRYTSLPNNIAFRTLRGGSWNDAAASTLLQNTSRTFAPPTTVDRLIGFRVVRTLPTDLGDLNNDDAITAIDYAVGLPCLLGPGTATPSCGAIDFDYDSDVDLKDMAAFSNEFGPP